jgi:hypothetical protein
MVVEDHGRTAAEKRRWGIDCIGGAPLEEKSRMNLL